MPQSPKSILITGGAGNIARLLAKRLIQDHYTIICTDIVEPRPSERVPNVEYETADICDEKRLEALLASRKPDVVFHLASLLSGSSEVDRRRALISLSYRKSTIQAQPSYFQELAPPTDRMSQAYFPKLTNSGLRTSMEPPK